MSAQCKTDFISQDEYHEILLSGDIKYEWFDGQMWPKEFPDGVPTGAPTAMAGTQPNHSRIKHNIERHLGNQLENGPCEVMSGDQKIRIEASDLNAFPDVVALCEDARFETVRGLETLLNPIVLVEILSPSTARFDLTDKWAHYQLIPSLRDYLVIFCDQMRVHHYVRQNDNSWNERVFVRPDEAIQLSGIAAQLTPSDIYKRVVFPEETTSRTPRLV
ncbi:Endonuclease, Uma2 family (restriction endonuclease fold) [Abditibacterium utsteinense]|uniref:Endonuclease, Uma2 family (Restriction endonuclease fold) n=1 Tax=Abditibacterium utsteinense TaxID=1960156 RepID=A0A2S8SSX1_9BACT|nr:Uma2 family endonuclease [Abditibacterium utsteinense]PQV63876.1 Endonuclease, Uma2 family (restriction endonuclease fold) [Abditibacterium utsteinense]